MKKYAIGILYIASAMLLTSCGMKYVKHSEVIQKYKGDNVETLISEWGAPQSTTQLASGNTVYLFLTEKEVEEKTGEIKNERWGSNVDGRSVAIYSKVTKKCKTTVTSNNKGKILSLNSTGEGCEGEWIKEAS